MSRKGPKDITMTAYRDPSILKETPSDEGFEISQDFIANISESMTRLNATVSKLTLTKSSKIMDRSMVLAIYDPERLTYKQSFVLWLFKRWL